MVINKGELIDYLESNSKINWYFKIIVIRDYSYSICYLHTYRQKKRGREMHLTFMRTRRLDVQGEKKKKKWWDEEQEEEWYSSVFSTKDRMRFISVLISFKWLISYNDCSLFTAKEMNNEFSYSLYVNYVNEKKRIWS